MLPLQNKTIVITRAKNQISDSSLLFKNLGANIIEFPAIEIIPPDDWTEFDDIVKSIKIDLIIFTSVNSVSFFYQRINQLKPNLDFKQISIIAVGTKTAEMCKQLLLKVDVVPQKFSSKGIIDSFSNIDLENKNVLLPQSDISKKDLAEELKKKKANVFQVTVYKNVLPNRNDLKEVIELIESSRIDVFIFTSPSTFRNFIELMNIKDPAKFFHQKVIAAIGETTEDEIKKIGLRHIIKPDISTLESLSVKLSEYFKQYGESLETT
jgi:uroporphyrinogen-III synthase